MSPRPAHYVPVAIVLLSIVFAALVASASIKESGATFTARSAPAENRFTAGDWTGPAVMLADPGSPLRGTVTLSATAADSIGTVTSVTIQRRRDAGAWTDVCTRTATPYGCAWDTTAVADGAYDLRAVAVDNAGNSTNSAVVAARVVANTVPGVTLNNPGTPLRGTVTLTASASAPVAGVRSVRIQRASAGTTQWTDVCTDTTAPYACPLDTTTLANDFYDLRAIAVDNAGSSTTSSVVADIHIDNAAPTVSVGDPGSPLGGVVTVAMTAADADSGVAGVVLQASPSQQGAWSAVCTDTTAPYSCRWDTAGVTDGAYDLRAIATDVAGNSATSATVGARRVDNSVSSVSLDDPGEFLRGTVTVVANASSTAGVASVAIQRAPAGTTTWTTICTDTVAPFSCPFDTTTAATPDGLYDLRAVMVTRTPTTLTSATITARRVDNIPVRGVDVQSANRAGGIVGRIETGDTLTLTWSKPMNPSTLIPGWSGAAAATVYARVRDGAAAGGTSQADVLDLWTNAAATGATGLGSVNLGGDFQRSGRVATLTSTAVLTTATVNGNAASVVTITFGAMAGSGLRAWSSLSTLGWTPSATAADTAGTKSSTAPATESGAADADF